MHDFLIIGGGIAGVSAAARLSELGTVLLLEAEDHLAFHASGRSAATFEENYGLAPTVALTRASRSYHEAAGVLSPRGLMVVATASDRDAFDHDVAALWLGAISPEEARAHVPILNDTVALAAISDAAQDLDTDKLVQGFARSARANGATFMTGTKVEALARTAGGWSARTSQGAVEGRLLVNAAGAWVDEVARMAGIEPLGVTPYRRSVARIPAPEGHDVSAWPLVFGPGETWYAKPDAGALIVSPAEEHPMDPHDAWADDMVLAEGLARYEAMVTSPVTRLISSWAGLRTFAPDRTLAIGFAPDDPGFFWVAAQGGYGMQSSPAASRLAADLIGGTAPELDAATVAALSPARFAR